MALARLLLATAMLAMGCGSDDEPLGRATTPSGTTIELDSFRDAGGPCLTISGLPGGTRACGRAPSERVPPPRGAIGGGVIVRRSPQAPLEVYGETAAQVDRVVVRYRLPDREPAQRLATLIRATDASALEAAGIREPFGYFVGMVPARARRVYAVALDDSSRELGRVGYDRLASGMDPTVFISTRD